MTGPSERSAAVAGHATMLDPAASGIDAGVKGVAAALAPARSRIVGLGEATHGTRECFQHKARLIRWLVAGHGYRTVAFEADAAAATALDAFVRGEGVDGDGAGDDDADSDDDTDAPADPAPALSELRMWQWRTESVADLLAWLRSFNAGRNPAEQVRVRGVDLSTPSAPAPALREYFERTDPAVLETDAFRTVESATVPEKPAERDSVLDAVAAAASTLVERVDATDGVGASSSVTGTTAKWLCRVVEQACEWARVRHEQPGPHEAGMTTRDRFMAENARWALAQDRGAGVALWAHDGHIGRGTFDDGTPWADATTMGERLARDLGDGYRPVGFDFAEGSFRAVGADSGELGTFSVGDPEPGSATETFARVEGAPYLLDLREAVDDERLGPWLGERRRKRYVGSVFDPEDGAGAADARIDLTESFDCLLFLPASTPTRPVDEG